MTTLLAQLTDLHIREPGRLAYGRLDTAPYLHRAVQAVMALRQKPTAVVFTGDLSDFGRAAEYEHLAALIAPLDMPVYFLPGNHDDRDQLRRSFPSHDYLGTTGFIHYAVQVGELRLIGLDTVDTGQSAGRLCAQRLAALEAELERDRVTPTVIAMHHPPFATLIGHMDRIGLLEGAGELDRLLHRYTHVERVICGHLHRSISTRFGGTLACTGPSPAHQVSLDLSPDAASTWTLEPPGFQIHAWHPASGMTTHGVPIGEFDGPHPFHENGQLID